MRRSPTARGQSLPRRLRALFSPPLPPTENFYIATVSGLELPESCDLRRSMPRPPEERDEAYVRAFDAKALFYDVFRLGDDVCAVGPPLRNLVHLTKAAALSLDGRSVDLQLWPMEHLSSGVIAGSGSRLALNSPEVGEGIEIAVQPSQVATFAGRRVLLTINQDNRLSWIADWVDFHVRAHGVDAVLLYDNGSQAYSVDDLLHCLRHVPGVAAAVVVPWRYKFGPGGQHGRKGWDGRSAQTVMWEHARRRFLLDAAGMINADIDELLVSETGQSVFDHLDRSPVGAVTYPGRWISPVRTGNRLVPRRFRHFRHAVRNEPLYENKWSCVPARIPDHVELMNHWFGGDFEATPVPDLMFRHFRSITTNWKYVRTRHATYRPKRHIVDDVWVRQMRRIGWID